MGSVASGADTVKATPFDRLGGQEVMVAIANRFYDLMDSDPAYAPLRAMHARDLGPMRASLAGFLTGWSGGPRDWFAANPGRCMVSIHKPMPITQATARQWADAMRRAIKDIVREDIQMANAMAGVLEEIAMGMVPV
jgi:hemoglobin